MKLNQLLSFGATASLATLLVVAGVSQMGNASPQLEGRQSIHTASLAVDSGRATSASAPFRQHNLVEPMKAASTTVAELSGNFVAAEAPTTGMAKIVEKNGQKYLEIDSAFSTTDQAPDLQVILDTVAKPPANYQDSESNRYLNLGGLQKVSGEQRYPIPQFVDAAQFKSVVIWCRTANATMGYADLANDSSASIN